MTRQSQPITVLGAGSFGTCLAIQASRQGHPVKLWGRHADEIKKMQVARENTRYLPECPFPEFLTPTANLEHALSDAQDVLVVVPSHALRSVLEQAKPFFKSDARIAWATKGFELETGLLPHQVVEEVLDKDRLTAVLSGPTFAKEVGKGLPTLITVGSKHKEYAKLIAHYLSDDHFRVYRSKDLVGVEVGGAVKNVIAIGAGISDGMGFGANARVAIINRGLVEMMRLGKKLGAKKSSFMGLAGMGDLVLTCTDNQSRNRRMGLALADGKGIEEAQNEIQQVVEGVQAAKAVHQMANKLGVDMPICEQVYKVIYEGLSPKEGVVSLMRRRLGKDAK